MLVVRLRLWRPYKTHVGGEASVVATVQDADEDDLVQKLGNLLQQIKWLEADTSAGLCDKNAGGGVMCEGGICGTLRYIYNICRMSCRISLTL